MVCWLSCSAAYAILVPDQGVGLLLLLRWCILNLDPGIFPGIAEPTVGCQAWREVEWPGWDRVGREEGGGSGSDWSHRGSMGEPKCGLPPSEDPPLLVG